MLALHIKTTLNLAILEIVLYPVEIEDLSIIHTFVKKKHE